MFTYVERETEKERQRVTNKQTDSKTETEYLKIKIQLYYHDVGDGFRILAKRLFQKLGDNAIKAAGIGK